jgi:hypothetical protein
MTVILICVLMMLMITSCTSTPQHEGKPLATMTFAHLSPVALNASEIQITVPNTIASPAVSYFIPSPSNIMEDYLTSRFQKDETAETGHLKIDVTTLSVQETHLPGQETKKRGFLEDRNQLLYIDINLDLHYMAADGNLKTTSLSANRQTLLNDNMTIMQRESAAQNMMSALITDIDPVIVRNLEALQAIN